MPSFTSSASVELQERENTVENEEAAHNSRSTKRIAADAVRGQWHFTYRLCIRAMTLIMQARNLIFWM